jgi:enamine deaminase RidA (YjgF/YER057c/UK114 family)
MTYVNPVGLAPTPGYSHAVVRRGTQVHLTGQIALDENGKLVGPGDIAAQVEQVWANIRTLCEGLGATLGDIVKLTTYTTSRAYLEAIGAERRRHFEPGAFPASTFLVISELASPDYLVEIEAIVVLPEDQ